MNLVEFAYRNVVKLLTKVYPFYLIHGAHTLILSSLMRVAKSKKFLTKVVALNKFEKYIHRVLYHEKLMRVQNKQKEHEAPHYRILIFEL